MESFDKTYETLENALFKELKMDGKIRRYTRSKELTRESPDYSGGKVLAYVAHVIYNNDKPTAVQIGEELEQKSGGANNPKYHPDQQFWTGKLKDISKLKSPIIVMTDCKALPCDDKNGGCEVKVPQLIAAVIGKDVPIWVFAHGDSHVAVPGEKKLVYRTFSGAKDTEIKEHIKATIGAWAWG